MQALEADEHAAALLPRWRQASGEEELWQAVAGIRRAAAAAATSDTSLASTGTEASASSMQLDDALEMWLPFMYGG